MIGKLKRLGTRKNVTGILATSFEPDFSGGSMSDPIYDIPLPPSAGSSGNTEIKRKSGMKYRRSSIHSGNNNQNMYDPSRPDVNVKSRRASMSSKPPETAQFEEQRRTAIPSETQLPIRRTSTSSEGIEDGVRKMNIQEQPQHSPTRPSPQQHEQQQPVGDHRRQMSDLSSSQQQSLPRDNNRMNHGDPHPHRGSGSSGGGHIGHRREVSDLSTNSRTMPMPPASHAYDSNMNRRNSMDNSAPPPSDPKFARRSSMGMDNSGRRRSMDYNYGGRTTPIDSRGRTTPIEKMSRRHSIEPMVGKMARRSSNDPQMGGDKMNRRQSNDPQIGRRHSDEVVGYGDQRPPVGRRQSDDYVNDHNMNGRSRPTPPPQPQSHLVNNTRQPVSRRHTNDDAYGRHAQPYNDNAPKPSRRHSNDMGYGNHTMHHSLDFNEYDNRRGPPPGNNGHRSDPMNRRRPPQRSSISAQSEQKYHSSNMNNSNPHENYYSSQSQSQSQQQQPSSILRGNRNSDKNNNLKMRVDKLKKIALENANKGMWLESHDLLLEALALQKDLQHDYLEKAHTCHHLGLALNRLRKYDSALDALYDSLSLRKKYGGDQLDIAATVHTIGVVKGFSGDYDGACKNLRMAATIQKSILGKPDETTLRILKDFEMKM